MIQNIHRESPFVKEETTVDWQKLHDDYQNEILGKDDADKTESGIIKHTNREYEVYYLEDYITVEFKGYEHDSECEVTVDWDKLADDLGNGITPEILESVYSFRLRDVKAHTDNVDDIVNGDRINLITSEKTMQDAFEQKYTKELKYIDEKVCYYEKTPVIISGLKTKAFLENISDIDKTAVTKCFDKTMSEIKESAKDYASSIRNDGGVEGIDLVLGRSDKKYTIKEYKADGTYFAIRTASSYNDTSASSLTENIVFNIYKLIIEGYESGEIIEMYYRTEIENLLYEDNIMVISDDTVKANFAGTADELMPDSKYWNIKEMK